MHQPVTDFVVLGPVRHEWREEIYGVVHAADFRGEHHEGTNASALVVNWTNARNSKLRLRSENLDLCDVTHEFLPVLYIVGAAGSSDPSRTSCGGVRAELAGKHYLAPISRA